MVLAFEVLLKAFDLCIADVAAVKKGEEVEQSEHGNQAQVHLAQYRLLVQVFKRLERYALSCSKSVDSFDLIPGCGVPMAAVRRVVGDGADAELVLGDTGFFVL